MQEQPTITFETEEEINNSDRFTCEQTTLAEKLSIKKSIEAISQYFLNGRIILFNADNNLRINALCELKQTGITKEQAIGLIIKCSNESIRGGSFEGNTKSAIEFIEDNWNKIN